MQVTLLAALPGVRNRYFDPYVFKVEGKNGHRTEHEVGAPSSWGRRHGFRQRFGIAFWPFKTHYKILKRSERTLQKRAPTLALSFSN